MATGGIFQLITNDGKQDRMLMATQLLNERLINIRSLRAANGLTDPTPTLVDIERTHILFVNAHFKPFAAIGYEYNRVKSQSGDCVFGGTAQFSIPQFGDFFHDMVLHMTVSSASMTDSGDRFAYADFLGHRILKKVAFTVNGNPLDEYTWNTYNTHFAFFVPPGKRTGWKRCVGQEIANEGFLELDNNDARECRNFKDGLQTPKATHALFELWIPLIFWFNKDPRLAIPSVSIPYGQRFIDVEFGAIADILCTTDNGGGGTLTANPTINNCELYINNIFVNPEIHDIYIKRVGFTLIRVHREQTTRVDEANKEVLLQRMKWPIETLYVCMKPTANLTGSGMCANWHRCHQVTDNTVCVPAVITPPSPPGSPAKQLVARVATYKTCTRTIDKLSIIAHGIPLYDDIPSEFFNCYIPYTYGGYNVVTPDDCGALMITFNLYPGSYQPSGHINVSRARELFLKYSSSFVSSSNTADLIVIGIAINFLLISDGSAVLRYST